MGYHKEVHRIESQQDHKVLRLRLHHLQ
jgi:hypothetical protein